MVSLKVFVTLLSILSLGLGQSTIPDLWGDEQPFPLVSPTTTYTRITTVSASSCPARATLPPFVIRNFVPARPVGLAPPYALDPAFIFSWHRSRHDYYGNWTTTQVNEAVNACVADCKARQLVYGLCRSLYVKWDTMTLWGEVPHWVCYTFASQIRPVDFISAPGIVQGAALNRVCDSVLALDVRGEPVHDGYYGEIPTTLDTSFTATATKSDDFTWDLSGFPPPSSTVTPTPTSEPFTWDVSGFDPIAESTRTATGSRETQGTAWRGP